MIVMMNGDTKIPGSGHLSQYVIRHPAQSQPGHPFVGGHNEY